MSNTERILQTGPNRHNERNTDEEKQKDVLQKKAALIAIAGLMTIATGYSMNETMEIERTPPRAPSSEESGIDTSIATAFPEYVVPVEDPEKLNPPTEHVEVSANDYVAPPSSESTQKPQAPYPPQPFQ